MSINELSVTVPNLLLAAQTYIPLDLISVVSTTREWCVFKSSTPSFFHFIVGFGTPSAMQTSLSFAPDIIL